MHRKDHCIFCKIVAGEAPCARVAEDETTLVFMDLAPLSEGHTLVITKEHFENLYEVTPEAIAAVGAMSARVAVAIRDQWQPDGLSVYQANGVAAGQTVFHYHMHLMPRAEGSVFNLTARRIAEREVLAAQAGALAERLRA